MREDGALGQICVASATTFRYGHLTLEAKGLEAGARALDFVPHARAAGPSQTPASEEVAVAVEGCEGWPKEVQGENVF